MILVRPIETQFHDHCSKRMGKTWSEACSTLPTEGPQGSSGVHCVSEPQLPHLQNGRVELNGIPNILILPLLSSPRILGPADDINLVLVERECATLLNLLFEERVFRIFKIVLTLKQEKTS